MNVHVMAARRRIRMTQAQLAKLIDLGSRDVVLVERHGWLPPFEIRHRFAQALESTERELFGDILSAAGAELSQ